MKKKTTIKLELSRETLRDLLEAHTLQRIAGAKCCYWPTGTICPTQQVTCDTGCNC